MHHLVLGLVATVDVGDRTERIVAASDRSPAQSAGSGRPHAFSGECPALRGVALLTPTCRACLGIRLICGIHDPLVTKIQRIHGDSLRLITSAISSRVKSRSSTLSRECSLACREVLSRASASEIASSSTFSGVHPVLAA